MSELVRRRSARTGLLARRASRSSSCSPAAATRPACSTSRCGSRAPTRSGRCTSTTGCATSRRRRRAPLRRAVRAPRECALAVRRPPRRPETGNLQAWARDVRYGRGGVSSRRRAPTSRPGTPPPTRSRRSSTGSRPRPAAGRCSGCARARGADPARCSRSRASRPTAYCTERGLAWREDESNDSATYARATGSARRSCRRSRQIHPAAEQNVLALAEILRDEAMVLDAVVDEVLTGERRSSSAGCASCRRRCARLVVQRLADAAVGRPAPGAARRADEIAALGRSCGARSAARGAGRRRQRGTAIHARTSAKRQQARVSAPLR